MKKKCNGNERFQAITQTMMCYYVNTMMPKQWAMEDITFTTMCSQDKQRKERAYKFSNNNVVTTNRMEELETSSLQLQWSDGEAWKCVVDQRSMKNSVKKLDKVKKLDRINNWEIWMERGRQKSHFALGRGAGSFTIRVQWRNVMPQQILEAWIMLGR